MGERLIKPYEISVWEDVLTQDGDEKKFIEKKLAVIGSNTMTGLNKVYNPVFNKKANGEKTLTFSLKYKYFDPYMGNEGVINPFVNLLINERKVKLNYDNQWYEFIVKDHNESSDGYEWTYTCTDAFILELSKIGYNLTFDSELNNNQGTAFDLAQKTLVNTDWQVGGANVGKQLVAEPIYKASLVSTTGIEIINASGTSEEPPTAPASIYLFYSYVKNQSGKFVQFIVRDDNRQYIIDDKNVITDTNFRITTDLVFNNNQFETANGTVVITLGNIENKYQANRLAYGQLNTYDSVMERTVDRFKVDGGDKEIYRYIDYTYTTSNIIMNYFTNGENFNMLEDGSLQGWNPYVDVEEGDPVNKLEMVTRPELGTGKELADISTLSQIEGFLKVKFNGALTQNYQNAVYNSGVENHASSIESISKGEKFVFRWRAGVRDNNLLPEESDLKKLQPAQTLRMLVAKYTQDTPNRWSYYYKHIDPNNIILQFEGTPQIVNNYVSGGTLVEITEINEQTGQEVGTGKYEYVIDGVVQTPSTKYIYIDKDTSTEYVWDAATGNFNSDTSKYLPYYYLVATANQALPGATLKDVTENIGIFIYSNNIEMSQIVVNDSFEPEPGETADYPTEVAETIEPKRGTVINVTYTSNSSHTYQFTAGTTNKTAAACQYDAATNTIDFNDGAGIHSYTITYQKIKPYYIQDIQFTRFVADGADATGNTPVLIGNIPTAISTATEYYYVKPDEGDTKEDIVTYSSLEELKEAESIVENILPMYNENSEKYLSISASQSNCFNILQTIAETFECWVDLVVGHDDSGYITYDNSGKPNKFVYLNEYAGKDNWAGFKYGVNLDTIERNINSDEIVTKLIVDQSQSDYADEGFISISNSPSNTSGESYILNFDYYYNQGLLDREEAESDRLQFISDAATLNTQLQEKEKQRRELEASLTELGSNRNVYTGLIESAQDMKTSALGEFELLTGKTYEEYKQEHTTIEEDEQLTEEETIYSILGELYVSSATINNYSGLLSNLEQEYWLVRKQLRGSENYKVKIWTGKDIEQQRHVFVELNDYLPGFKFTIGSYTGTSTTSKKYFDRQTDETVITFEAPSGFTITPTTYNIVDGANGVYFKIISDESFYGVEDDIEELLHQKEDLINAFNNKYSRFIQEGTWSSTDYIDSELYYLDALQVSNTSAQPTVSYTINVVEISELEGFEWYSFDAGDKSYVEDTEFFGWVNINGVLTPAQEEVIVSEIEWHLEEPDKNVITVQNYKTRFEDFFQRVNATVQTVQYNEATYAKISSLLDANGTINQDVLLESLNNVSGRQYSLTGDGSVRIDDDQIYIKNLTNPANCVIINSEGIRVSSDGSQNYTTVINGQGINIGAVYTGTLNTNEVIIGSSDNPSFRWDKAGISAYKSGQDGIYDLQTYVRYDQYGLYGIKEGGSFKAQNLQDVLDKAHFAVTWDGFFIKNSYEDGGRVSITSDNDFQVIDGTNTERIKIGSLGVDSQTNERIYGINISDKDGNSVLNTDNDGNITITGTLNATAGEFSGLVQVGDGEPHINIDGANALISTSDYSASSGWMINADGDAVFNNITARGAIKTTVFEYAEIQAIGGIFIFRPSSTIRSAAIDGNNLVLSVEKPLLFKVGQWCKVSNYIGKDQEPIDTQPILLNNGLTHVYRVESKETIGGITYITLLDAAAMVEGNDAIVSDVTDLIGGALIDMGNKAGTSNYGIGINSSDNTVNLPARAISLFETVVDETQEPKISYNYRGILGTLPSMSSGVNSNVYQYMQGTQGIYTDNMYIGDGNQYIAFYTDGNYQKQLKIKANTIVYEVDGQGNETTWEEHINNEIDEQIPIRVEIVSSAGELFVREDIRTTLTCYVYKGTNEITNQVTKFTWSKYIINSSGTKVKDETWARLSSGRQITIGPEDVASKAIFECEVEF